MSRFGVLATLSTHNKRIFHGSMLFLANRKLAWVYVGIPDYTKIGVHQGVYSCGMHKEKFRFTIEFTKEKFVCVAVGRIAEPMKYIINRQGKCYTSDETIDAIYYYFARFNWDSLMIVLMWINVQ